MRYKKYRQLRSTYRNVLLRTKGRFLKIRNLTFHHIPIKKIALDRQILYTRRWSMPSFLSTRIQ